MVFEWSRPGRCWRRRGESLPLQGQVHALLPTVLLLMTRLNAFDVDAQPQPPRSQSERNAIVRMGRP